VDDLAYLDEEEASLLPKRQTMLTIVLPTIEVGAVAAINLGFAVNANSMATLAEAMASQAVTLNL
jgi:hypothetical protein